MIFLSIRKRWVATNERERDVESSRMLHGIESRKENYGPSEQIESSMKAVTDDGMPATHTARIYAVPPSTLKDRISGSVVHGKKPSTISQLH